ncbi:MAG: hypothetical protein LBP33_03395 [Candidatus Adiutrix sp.]|jgi:hypothetical protein|nr:hypothetical protein [Candidatus Adiutrix sp.]
MPALKIHDLAFEDLGWNVVSKRLQAIPDEPFKASLSISANQARLKKEIWVVSLIPIEGRHPSGAKQGHGKNAQPWRGSKMSRNVLIEVSEEDAKLAEERLLDLGISLNEGLKRMLVKIGREPEFTEMLSVPNAATIATLDDADLFDAESAEDLL